MLEKKYQICDGICENRPHCTRHRNRDSPMNDVIEVWSRSGENLEVIACIFLEIQKHSPENGHLLQLLRCVLHSLYTSAILSFNTSTHVYL